MTPLRDRFGRSWAGRRVTVVGLGRSGIAAARLLIRVGARVRVTDARQTPQLQQGSTDLLAHGVEAVELGGHTRPFIDGAQVVVVSPGVAEAQGPIPWALEARCPVISEIELAFAFCPSPIAAVTGTNGKSTAVTLIADVIRATGRMAVACGNIGIPFSAVVSTLTPEAVAVVEVSSFQLLWCEAFRPTVGVLLNVGTNHLDRHQDPRAYLAAKARLFQRQTEDDWAVLNGNDPRITALGERAAAQRVWFGDNRTNPERFRLAPQTLRAFNEGAQAVLQVGRIFGIADALSWQVLRAFRGLEHRLEPVAATPRGVRWVNDSKSTTPESLLFALRQTPGRVVVILGGRDKRLDFSALVEPLHDAKRIHGIVLIGESRPRLKALLNGTNAVPVRECDTLEEAVRTAESLAQPGATVLFSPACASFDMFQDFEARGRAFKALVGSSR